MSQCLFSLFLSLQLYTAMMFDLTIYTNFVNVHLSIDKLDRTN